MRGRALPPVGATRHALCGRAEEAPAALSPRFAILVCLAGPLPQRLARPYPWREASQHKRKCRRHSIADNKSKRGKGDRSKVAASEGYELYYFARKHQITPDQARKLIERIGNDRDKLNAAAGRLKKR